jgi:hypothetical protein
VEASSCRERDVENEASSTHSSLKRAGKCKRVLVHVAGARINSAKASATPFFLNCFDLFAVASFPCLRFVSFIASVQQRESVP